MATGRLTRSLLVLILAWIGGVQDPQDPTAGDKAPGRPVEKTIHVKRARRPVFRQRDWDGIYFENLFAQGLVGSRPAPRSNRAASDSSVASNDTAGEARGTGTLNNAASPPDADGGTWRRLIAGEVIEDEVKRLEQTLRSTITTPGRFKSEYGQIHQAFSTLALMFGLIHQYDGDVRWKDQAPVALPTFARAAASSRVGTLQAYNFSKLQLESLTELVRGGNFNANTAPIEEFDWSETVERSPLMVRLETSFDTSLKPDLASNTEFKKHLDRVKHEASMVAAIGQVLIQENMDDAEDDDYAEYARQMTAAALEVMDACKTDQYDRASDAANRIGQSCSNCHDDWR